jgi:hypothetical protein
MRMSEQARDRLLKLLRRRRVVELRDLFHEGRIGCERYRAAEQVRQRLEGDQVVARILPEPTVEETIEILGEALRSAAEIPSPLEVVRAPAARGVSVESHLVHCVYEAHELRPGKKTAPPTGAPWRR